MTASLTASLTDGTTTLDRDQAEARLYGAVVALRELTDGTSGRVAVMAHNSVETVLTHAAVILAGLSAVPVSFHLTAGEVAYLLETSGAALLVADAQTAAVAAEAAARAGGVRVVDTSLLAVEAQAPEDLRSLRPRPPMLFTSGTTGRPKPVEQPPTMFPRVDSVAELLTVFAENPLAQHRPHLVVGPLYHTGPLTAVRLLLAGTPLVVMPRFDAEGVLRAIQEHRIQGSVMVPTHFSRLLALPEDLRASYDVSSLREVVHTGSACPVDVKRKMIEWWGPVLVEAYGGTEVGTTTSLDSTEWLAHPGSVGRAVPPFEVLVLDEDGREVPTGEPGQLCFRDATGRGLVYAVDGLTGTTYGPGVFTLGEVGRVDEDGFVWITDRTADLVVSGGVNIYPAEVERVLLAHPDVEDVAVFGVPVEDLGEELRALVVVTGDVTPEDLMALCRSELAGFKCPRRLDLVDGLPRTTMGKLDKRVLRERYGAGVSTSDRS
ncbi:AMP-binding protein [Nocardioides marmoribigeumensis]|uniref:Long-chain acyl-CoA synthetase n=1 Tax=Nocardioides marmoribigeumensis TaxID=433649 RepID=A0ABU2BXZ9_9ACTN|nr:AMP-binding protein [Nocardioides marmoribigeumensis]MDR7363267.1 long-chain acyl-CoA synthetase [Nocardioides marmoribigeumensis]